MESPLPPNNASQSSNTGLIAGIIIMAVVIILLTLVLVIVVSTKLKRFQKNEAAYINSINVYYDYPTMNIQSINVKKNKAYAANDNIETNPNEAYAIMMNTTSILWKEITLNMTLNIALV